MKTKNNKDKSKVVDFKDIDMIEALSARCRRKYRRARNEMERGKYARFLEILNVRIKKIQDEILDEIERLNEKIKDEED